MELVVLSLRQEMKMCKAENQKSGKCEDSRLQILELVTLTKYNSVSINRINMLIDIILKSVLLFSL